MKKLIVLFLCVTCAAQITQIPGLRERLFKTKPSVDLKGSSVRVTSGELFLDRNAILHWEIYGATGKIVDRGELLLDRPMLRSWMNSDTPVDWLRSNILQVINLQSDE